MLRIARSNPTSPQWGEVDRMRRRRRSDQYSSRASFRPTKTAGSFPTRPLLNSSNLRDQHNAHASPQPPQL